VLDVQPAGVVHTVGVPSRETLEAFASDEFLTGLAYGIGALILGLVVAYLWRRRCNTPAPVVGLLLTGGALAGLSATRGLPSDLWIGLVLLAVAGGLYPWARRVPLLAAVVAIPGAWWVTQVVELPGARWVPWLLFAWIVLGAPLVTSFDRHFQDRGYGPVLVAISIAGMFVTLPDTEEILVVFGVAVALVFLAWPKVFGSLGAVGIYPLLGVLAWVIAFGREGTRERHHRGDDVSGTPRGRAAGTVVARRHTAGSVPAQMVGSACRGRSQPRRRTACRPGGWIA